MNAYHLRSATPNDADAIAEIRRIALGYDNDLSASFIAQRLQNVLPLPGHHMLAAEANGKVIGLAHAGSYDTFFLPPAKELLFLGVLPPYQGRGIGGALLAAIEVWAKAEGASYLLLLSGAARKNAHAFYRAHGYEEDVKHRFTKEL